MSNKGDYTIELTEIVVSLKNSLDRCITLIRKITDENVDLNKSNHTLNSKLEELQEEMANYTKVSFVSNLIKQITEKDHQIVTLKRKLCKLESENKELTKIKIDQKEEILIEVGEKSSEKVDTNEENNTSKSSVKQFIDSLNKEEKSNTIHLSELSDNEEAEDSKPIEIDNTDTEQDEQEETDEEDQDNDSAGEDQDEKSDREDEEEEEENDKVEEDEESDREEEDEESDREDEEEESDRLEEDEEEESDRLEEDEEEESDGEEIEFEVKKIRRKNYYVSNEEPQGVYEIMDDEEVGDKIGDLINNKLVKSTN